MSAIELTLADVARDMDALHGWLRVHDLDPVCTQPRVRIENDRVYATLYVRDEDGKIVAERDPITDEFLGPKVIEAVRDLRQPVPEGLGTVIA